MACLSDVDLATLHRNRLEERVHYKLSWWARRVISDTQKQIKNHRNVLLSGACNGARLRSNNVREAQRSTTHQLHTPYQQSQQRWRSVALQQQQQQSNANATETAEEKQRQLEQQQQREREAEQRLIDNCFRDDDYFTAEHRRRSGTWP